MQGKVQGVGFRRFVREQARDLALRGWVRNEASGDVVLEASGDAASLDRLQAMLRVGPPASTVHAVLEEPPTAADSGALPSPFAMWRD